MAEAIQTEDTQKTHWQFVENNEWEGEIWTAYFEADAELEPKLLELSALLFADEKSPYSLEAIEEIPDEMPEGEGELEECEYADSYDDDDGDDGEGCGDCDYCNPSEGYYAAYGVYELSIEKLNSALEEQRHAADGETSQEDSLYKLGLFSD